MSLARTRKPLRVYQDDPTSPNPTPPTRSARKSSVPLAARTRSMTRLSSVATANTAQAKLGRIDRLTGRLADKENTAGARAKQVVGKRSFAQTMMDLQATDRLKRKVGVDGDSGAKRAKREQDDTLRALPVNQTIPPPLTPVQADRVVLPTPARVILGAKQQVDEDDTSPEAPSRFIARPPTPPRPHMALLADRTQPPSRGMDSDSEETHTGSVPSTPTRSHPTLLAPVTPRSTAITPKRVMSGISRFRSGTASSRKPFTPKTPGIARPLLASLLAAPREEGPEDAVLGASGAVAEEPVASGEMDTTAFARPPMKSESAQHSAEDLDLTHDRAMGQSGQAVGETDQTMGEPDQTMVEPDQTMSDPDQTMREPEQTTEHPSQTTVEPDQTMGEPNQTMLDPFQPRDEPSQTTVEPSQPEPPAHRTATSPAPLMPPSRIPRTHAPFRPRSVAQPTRPNKSSIPVLSKPAHPANTLGRGLPSSAPSNLPPASTSTTAPTRRKPSYPSSLGSGPLDRPRDRMVSGPTLYAQPDGTLGTKKDEPRKPGSPRSVSEPTRGLSASTRRREGLSLETSKSLAGLADALKTLRMRRPEEPKVGESSTGLAPSATIPPVAPTVCVSAPVTSSRLGSIHRPRHSVLPAPGDESISSEEGEHAGDRSLAAIMSSTCGEGCLKGVVAFVDVKTADGDDAGLIFSDMLKSLGAKVQSRLTDNVTHIIYKSGKPTTLAWYRKRDEGERPFIVGIRWVTRSKEQGERLDEQPFVVPVSEEDIFQKRRKSMEPKALTQSKLSVNTAFRIVSARQQSMMYAPKISSPLKKAFRGEDE